MQIMKRAKSGGEIIAFNDDPESVREESLRRVARAGYTRGKTKIMADAPNDRYRENYDKIDWSKKGDK